MEDITGVKVSFLTSDDETGIRTECQTEEEFIREVSKLLSRLIGCPSLNDPVNENNWQVKFESILPQIIEVTNSYRGYKTECHIHSVIEVGLKARKQKHAFFMLGDVLYGTKALSEDEAEERFRSEQAKAEVI